MSAPAFERVRQQTWALYIEDGRVCSVCVRIGGLLAARAMLEDLLEQADGDERKSLAVALAWVSSQPMPRHEP